MSEPAPAPTPPAPPPPAPWKLSGYVFGDYYYFAANNDARFDGQHGFWIRRAYLTYDHALSRTFTTRVRLEVTSNGKLSGGALTPYVKDAYLKWSFHGRQQVTLGIQPTLSFDYLESVWGLRHIEKTPLDLYRWDSSRDFGLTVAGPVNAANTVKYSAQFGNESSSNSETDTFKAVRAAARYEANPGFTVEGVFAQFHRRHDADRMTAQVFAGYRSPTRRAGVQYARQWRRAARGTAANDVTLDIVSGFAVLDLEPVRHSIFLRVDRYAGACPDCSGIDYVPLSNGVPFTMVIAGYEHYLLPSVRIGPNVQYVTYGSPGAGRHPRPKDDWAVRATFYWVW